MSESPECSERQPLLLQTPSSDSLSALTSITKRYKSKYGLQLISPTQSLLPPLGPTQISQTARHGILAGLWLAQFLSALNVTLVPTMLPKISSEFQSSTEASWVGTSYLLAACTFTPLYGRLSDVLGRQVAVQLALLLASVGVLICGLSNNIQVLVIGRFVSGMGGGGIVTTSLIVASDMYNMRTRGFIQSIGGIFYGLGMGLGGPVGGLITDWVGWRCAFLLQIPLFLLAFVLMAFHLTYVVPGTAGLNTKDILGRIDYGGSLSLLCSLASLLFFLSQKYNEGLDWTNPSVWISFILFVAFAFLFVYIEISVATEPILPAQFLTHRVPVLVGCSHVLVAVANLSVIYYFPMWFQTVMLSSASAAGLHLLPNSVCISTGSLFAGWMMKRYGRYKAVNMIFGILPFFAAILMTQMKESSNSAHLWLTIMPFGFGNAVIFQTMFIALVSHIPESQMPVGTGFSQLFRGLGQVGGLAAASALFQTRLMTELTKRLPAGSDELIKQIRQSSQLLADLPPDLQRTARDAYASSLKSVFVLAAVASLLGFLARLPIPDKRLEDGHPPYALHSDSESSSDSSSVYEEPVRDDEDKIVRPGYYGSSSYMRSPPAARY